MPNITVFATTAIDDSTVGTKAWSNPGNVTADDGNWGTGAGLAIFATDASAVANSHYIRCTPGSLAAIPATATIEGIEIELERAEQADNRNVVDFSVRLYKAGSTNAYVGDNKADTLTEWAIGDGTTGQQEIVTYPPSAGSTDLWGTTWTRDEVVNDLQVGISATSDPMSGFVAAGLDYVKFTIYYSVPIEEIAANTNVDWTGSATIAGGLAKIEAHVNSDWSGSASILAEKHLASNVDIDWSGSASITSDFSFKWSVEHLEASTSHGFPSVYVEVDNTTQPADDFSSLVSNEVVFERRLLEMPRLQEVQLDERSGLAGFQRVTIQADNSDGLLNGLDLQDSFVRMFFVDADGVSYKEFNGKVVDWILSHTVTINVEDLDALAFTQELPKRTLNDLVESEKERLDTPGTQTELAEFTNSVVANDLGKPIPIMFGRAVKVPLLYIKADETLVMDESKREYDYILGQGIGLNGNNFEEVFTVYRDERTLGDIEGQVNFGASDLNTVALEAADNNPDNFYQYWYLELFDDSGLTDLVDTKYVTSSTEDSTTPTVELDSNLDLSGSSSPYYYRLREYRFYDGSQTSPYPGYAFIRSKKRFGTSSRTDDLYADVNGFQDEVNRVRAIESILSNSTWGLGLTVDATSFTTAADIFWNSSTMMGIDPFTCEGAILNQTTATDIFQKLLSFRDMVLYKESDIKISVDQDKPTPVFNFGLGDEAGYNNILNASPAITYKHPNEKVKDLKVRYRKNHRENDTYLHEFTRASSTNGVDENLDMPFVYDHETADRALDYKRKRFAAADRNLSLDIGDDGKKAKRGDLVTIDIPTLGISSNWEIISSSVTPAGSNNLNLAPFSSAPYSYTSFTSDGGTLPVDESFDIPPDYTNSAPFPATSVSVSMLEDVVALTIFPYAKITWTPPEDNYGGAVVSVKLHSEGSSEWRDIGTFDTTARIESLIPGQLYDFRITSLNITGERKGLAVLDDNSGNGYLAGGDSSSPNTPTGLTGSSKFGELIWTWTNSTSNDVKYHEVQVYSASSGGTLLDSKKYFEGDIPQHKYTRQTGNLTSSLSGWARVRAVDYSGNPTAAETGWTVRVQAITGEVGRGDATNNDFNSQASAFNNGTITLDDGLFTEIISVSKFINSGQQVSINVGFNYRFTADAGTPNTTQGKIFQIKKGGVSLGPNYRLPTLRQVGDDGWVGITVFDIPGNGTFTYSVDVESTDPLVLTTAASTRRIDINEFRR